ncbi:hypothetical protein HR51_28360 [Burkholderia cepacia]|nr:hypothetical protein HR51_28360 [Burkholderia cepacia]
MLTAIASDVLRDIRQAKSEAKVLMKAAVAVVRVGDTVKRLAALQQARTIRATRGTSANSSRQCRSHHALT